MRGFLLQTGITTDEFAFYDGSGLSRQNLVTPDAIIKLLSWITQQPWGQQYIETLPVAGVDGSLGERMKKAAAEGRVRAKTGSLGHVNALSGYATTLTGEPVVFSIMANNHKLTTRRALDTLDRIVDAIVSDK